MLKSFWLVSAFGVMVGGIKGATGACAGPGESDAVRFLPEADDIVGGWLIVALGSTVVAGF